MLWVIVGAVAWDSNRFQRHLSFACARRTHALFTNADLPTSRRRYLHFAATSALQSSQYQTPLRIPGLSNRSALAPLCLRPHLPQLGCSHVLHRVENSTPLPFVTLLNALFFGFQMLQKSHGWQPLQYRAWWGLYVCLLCLRVDARWVVCLPVCLSVCLSFSLSVCPSVCAVPGRGLREGLPVCLSVCLSVCPSVRLSVCLSVCRAC
jgi:hypothetical protein